MQRIERYGVIALVLLLVTIAAVSFWEEPAKPNVEQKETVAQVSKVLPGNTPRDADRKLPVTASPSAASRARNQRAAVQQRARQLAQQAELQRKAQREAEPSAKPVAQQPQPNQQPSLAEREAPVEVLGFPDALNPAKVETPVVVSVESKPKEVTAPVVVETRQPSKSKMRVEPAKSAVKSTAGASGVYVVKANETLSEIAYKTLGSSKRWPELAELNGGSERIFEGQRLRLPGVQLAAAASAPKTTPIQSAAPSAKRTASSGGTYVVKKGDMLSVIAQTELGSAKRWREIAKLNPKVDPDRLLEGTRLVMPTGASQGPKVAQAGSGKRQATSSVRRVR